MKRIHRLIFAAVLLLFLYGCNEHRYPQSLLDADSLMNEHTDSALAILNQVESETKDASESVQRYYQLLRIKADDKTGKMKISPDSIRDLVRYYEEDGDEAMLPTAYYYAGRVYSDLNEAPISLSYFQKSLDAMDNKGINDLQLKSVIYSQMGYLYLFQYIYEEAEHCFHASYEIGIQTNDTISIFWGLRDIGATYYWKGNYNKSLEYYKKAAIIATKSDDKRLIANISNDIAYLHNRMGRYAKARENIQKSLNNIELLDSNSVLSSALTIYANTNEVDSFLQTANLLEKAGDAFSKRMVYDKLTKFYLNEGDLNKARIYYENYKIYNDSTITLTKSGELQKVHSIYKLNKEESKNAQLEKQKLIREFLLLVLLMGILALLTYIRSYRIKNLERFKRFRILQREIQSKNAIIKKIGQDNSKRTQENIKSSAIYKTISEKTKTDSVLNESEWAQIELLVNDNYPNFKERLSDLYEFSTHEYHLCMLIKLGLGLSQIGILTAHSKSSVTNSRSRLYRKCFGKEGSAKQWDDFIHSL